jgi:hypothetical protein
MKKMMNTNIILFVLVILLIILAYNYFSSLPVESDNTSMNDDDSITFSINQYEPTTDLNYSFIENTSDFSFNTVELQSMGQMK